MTKTNTPKLETLQAEYDELKEALQRMQADFENYKKWVVQNQSNERDKGKEALLKELLPLLDQIDAAKNAGEIKDDGLGMIFKEFLSVLEKQGLEQIDALGKNVDPYVHEVVMQAESDKESGTIIEEFQKGYRHGDVVIRHSKVKVSK